MAALCAAGCAEDEPPRTHTVKLPQFAAPDPIGGPSCAPSERRCTVTIAYVDRGESSVEVRGDFTDGGWVSGTPMAKRGKTWIAELDVPYGRDVQYKLRLDGVRWIRDPARPDPAPGTDNSRMDAVTCHPHRCELP